MGVSEVGPVRGIVADLSKLVVLQGVEPEGDIADVASGVEVCERGRWCSWVARSTP